MVCVILIAEDEVLVRNFARHLLEAEGHEVLAAADGAEALEISRRYAGAIDLLITDVLMPRMGGLELIRQILQERPGLRILIMSGKLDDAKGLPALPFLQKPFPSHVFRAKVREVIEAPPPARLP
jgi:CheY-like chemotaxis protein